jgi:hypothetical protein
MAIFAESRHDNAGIIAGVQTYHNAAQRGHLPDTRLLQQQTGPQGARRILEQFGMQFLPA